MINFLISLSLILVCLILFKLYNFIGTVISAYENKHILDKIIFNAVCYAEEQSRSVKILGTYKLEMAVMYAIEESKEQRIDATRGRLTKLIIAKLGHIREET